MKGETLDSSSMSSRVLHRSLWGSPRMKSTQTLENPDLRIRSKAKNMLAFGALPIALRVGSWRDCTHTLNRFAPARVMEERKTSSISCGFASMVISAFRKPSRSRKGSMRASNCPFVRREGVQPQKYRVEIFFSSCFRSDSSISVRKIRIYPDIADLLFQANEEKLQ